MSAAPITITLTGELDIARREELDQCVEASAAAAGDVVLDLRQVSFLDSSGLSAIARTAAAVHARSAQLRITGASARVASVLELAGVDRLADAVDRLDDRRG